MYKKEPVIYKLTNKINGKIYIGKTISFKNRMNHYKSHQNSRYDQPILRAIKKYRWINFKSEILESFKELNEKVLLDREEYWIKYCDSTNRKTGYNICPRGVNTTGFKHKKSTLKKLSILNSGKNNAFYGKKHSKETKEKLSKFLKGKNTKKIKQIDIKTNKIIKIWNSISEAAISLGNIKRASNITAVCRKQKNKDGHFQKTAFGFKWKYVE